MFLTISAVIFAGVALTFEGQRGKTDFQQGMRDLASKLQANVDQVGTGVFPGSSDYNCSGAFVSGNTRATLSAGSGNLGTNRGCIFLGMAVRVSPSQQTIYFYPVLGNQYTATGDTVTSLAAALPNPAADDSGIIDGLVEQYSTPWGTLQSSQVTHGIVTDSYMVGFYNSLQDGYNSTTAGGQSIEALGYPYTSANPTDTGIQNCIQQISGGGCFSTPLISSWSLCYSSSGSNQTALLTVAPTPGGLTTNLNFTSCS